MAINFKLFLYAIFLWFRLPKAYCQLSNKTNIHNILNTPENANSLNFVAVFILTTLDEFFYQRIKTSKKTWAHPIKHYYAVTGENAANRMILSNTQRCHNNSEHYRHSMKHILDAGKEEIYRCDGIDVLHLPYCDHSSWGPMGPCCRCEAAMRFYLNMASIHHEYPPWFIFSDDDYYTRVYKLQGILSKVDPKSPYAVNGRGGTVHAGKQGDVLRQTSSAFVPFFQMNCSVPCTHASNWYGYGVFSIGAMKAMESEVRRGGFIEVCRVWGTTHDVGFGIFVWELAIPFLPVCCGPQAMHDHNVLTGVYYHAIGKQKGHDGELIYQNDMMQTLWEYSIEQENLHNNITTTTSSSTSSNRILITKTTTSNNNNKIKLINNNKNNSYNNNEIAKKYQAFEYQQGLDQFEPPFPIAGFENSLFYRKVQFSETVAHQIPEHQLKIINAQLTPPQALPIHRTSFGRLDCNREMEFHIHWRLNNSIEFSLFGHKATTISNKNNNNSDNNNNNMYNQNELKLINDIKKFRASPNQIMQSLTNSPNQIKMCVKYLETIQNTPVSLHDLIGLPPLDDLERK